MNAIYSITSIAMMLLAAVAFWAAYQLAFRRRMSLVRIGSQALPGAELLATSFSRVLVCQGLVALAAAVAAQSQDFRPTTALIAGIGTALCMAWRGLLVRAIERYAAALPPVTAGKT